MTIRFDTESGSAYELDAETKRIRRLGGANDPTPRQGADGEWRAYDSASHPVIGESVVICWDPETTALLAGSPEGAIPATITSLVVRTAVLP